MEGVDMGPSVPGVANKRISYWSFKTGPYCTQETLTSAPLISLILRSQFRMTSKNRNYPQFGYVCQKQANLGTQATH